MNKKGQMSGGAVALIILGIVVFLVLIAVGMYNGLVKKDVEVTNQWAKVQASYQRRADLIPNLVETVKGSASFEMTTLTQITEMRSQAGQIQSQVASATTPEQLAATQSEMSGLLSRLMVIVEAYPTLKSNENFLALQDELAGTENRIQFERNNYNDAVRNYQVGVRSFPTNIIANMYGFDADKYNMFQADAGADKAPKVGFNFTN